MDSYISSDWLWLINTRKADINQDADSRIRETVALLLCTAILMKICPDLPFVSRRKLPVVPMCKYIELGEVFFRTVSTRRKHKIILHTVVLIRHSQIPLKLYFSLYKMGGQFQQFKVTCSLAVIVVFLTEPGRGLGMSPWCTTHFMCEFSTATGPLKFPLLKISWTSSIRNAQTAEMSNRPLRWKNKEKRQISFAMD